MPSKQSDEGWQLQEAKNRLSALIDAVEAGEEQVITRRGRPVAVVVRFADWQLHRTSEERNLYRTLREAATCGGLPVPTLRDPADEGRTPDLGGA
jgi:prevent-host-death family protein